MTATAPRLSVIVTSTREGRGGLAVGEWATARARAHGTWDAQLVDLLPVGLPLLDEPNHPNQRRYTNGHTKRWSATIEASDAFVFVTPEYNYGLPPALLNALDYLFHEWHFKAAAFVSYGGMSGGVRSVQHAKPVLTTLKIMPIPEAVAIPFYTKLVTDEGRFEPGANYEQSATTMLDELYRWTSALKTLRQA